MPHPNEKPNTALESLKSSIKSAMDAYEENQSTRGKHDQEEAAEGKRLYNHLVEICAWAIQNSEDKKVLADYIKREVASRQYAPETS